MFSSSGFKEKLQSSCLLITPGNSGELALSLYLKHHCSGACPFSNSLVNIYLSQALFGYKEWRHSELFKYKETLMRRRAKRQHISRLLEIQVAIKWLFYLFFLKFYKLLLALSSRATQEYICSLSHLTSIARHAWSVSLQNRSKLWIWHSTSMATLLT